jgi:hypothetical protein
MKHAIIIIEIIFFCFSFMIICNQKEILKEQKQYGTLLNNDSIYLKEIECIISLERESIQEKQEKILLNIASHFIKKNENEFKTNDGLNCNIPVFIKIKQEKDFNNNMVFSVYWVNFCSTLDLATKITKINDRYVLMNFKDGVSLPKEKLPDILLADKCDIKVIVINELSWKVLMCKNSVKHIVIMDIMSEYEYMDYFNDFSCE